MKNYFNIFILFSFFNAMSQNYIEKTLNSCRTVCENNIFKYNKRSNSAYQLHYNKSNSYVNIYFINETIKPKKIEIDKINDIKPLLEINKYNFDYTFVYDLVYKGYAINKLSLKCGNDNLAKAIADFDYLIKKIKTGKLLDINKILKIAKTNNFVDICSFELDEDPRWMGNDFYEADEKKWRITWTLKQKNISKDGAFLGSKVIKIDAENGKILSTFLEFPID